MAKSKPFTLQDLHEKGFVKNEDGTYAKSTSDYEVAISAIKQSLAKKPHVAKQPVIKTPDFVLNKPVESFLVINGIVPGLNGNKGLMRLHWALRKKQKEKYKLIVREQFAQNKLRKHEGKVKVQYIGYKSILSDFDNFVSSGKLIFDALVEEGIIIDDSAKVIVDYKPIQIKCKRAEQKVIVIIQDAEAH